MCERFGEENEEMNESHEILLKFHFQDSAEIPFYPKENMHGFYLTLCNVDLKVECVMPGSNIVRGMNLNKCMYQCLPELLVCGQRNMLRPTVMLHHHSYNFLKQNKTIFPYS